MTVVVVQAVVAKLIVTLQSSLAYVVIVFVISSTVTSIVYFSLSMYFPGTVTLPVASVVTVVLVPSSATACFVSLSII